VYRCLKHQSNVVLSAVGNDSYRYWRECNLVDCVTALNTAPLLQTRHTIHMLVFCTATLTQTRYIPDIPDIFDEPAVDTCVGTVDIGQRRNDTTTQTASVTSQQHLSFIKQAFRQQLIICYKPTFNSVTSPGILTAHMHIPIFFPYLFLLSSPLSHGLLTW